jgi:hypothetical protein
VLHLLLSACAATPSASTSVDGDGLDVFTTGWRNDRTWRDGQAECCVYDATRAIYGTIRHYRARVYTDLEAVNLATRTKSASNRGYSVFKHHIREDIQTENYAYHYSTMAFIGSRDLKSFKLDMGSEEDCGATFKQVINADGLLGWNSFSYFPDQGHTRGSMPATDDLAFNDALGFILRGYPFEKKTSITLRVVPRQASNKETSMQPVLRRVHFIATKTIDLPVGKTVAHHLFVEPDEHYWFAADGSAPMLHVMVRYDGPVGHSYRLRSIDRRKYWERKTR